MPDFGDATGKVDINSLCVDLGFDVELFQTTIEVPVGFSIDIQPPFLPDPGDVSGRLLAAANAALAPFSPIFDVVDVLIVLVEIAKAIPNPVKIGQLLPKVKVKIDRLAKLIPQLAIPRSIKSILGVLILALQALKIEIEAILAEQSKIDLGRQRAIVLGLADLSASLDCAQAGLDFQLDVARQNAAPLNRLINTINFFCDLAGVDGVPAITLDASAEAGALVKPLDEAIAKLQALRDKIPV